MRTLVSFRSYGSSKLWLDASHFLWLGEVHSIALIFLVSRLAIDLKRMLEYDPVLLQVFFSNA
jgi:hypothetical protein